MLRHYATRREVLDSISSRVLGNFEVPLSFCPHSVALGSTHTLTEMSAKGFPWGKMWPALSADSCAVLVMPNIKVRMEVQNFISPLSVHELLRERFTFEIMFVFLEG